MRGNVKFVLLVEEIIVGEDGKGHQKGRLFFPISNTDLYHMSSSTKNYI